MKRQFEHGHHNRQDKTKKPDYREGFAEEGSNFDRGGKEKPSSLFFRGNNLYIDLRGGLSDDKRSLVETLYRHTKFIVGGRVGTIMSLRKNPDLTDDIDHSFKMTCRSIIGANDIIGVAPHPKKKRDVGLLEFKCFLKPVEPFQNPIFKYIYAFRMIIPEKVMNS